MAGSPSRLNNVRTQHFSYIDCQGVRRYTASHMSESGSPWYPATIYQSDREPLKGHAQQLNEAKFKFKRDGSFAQRLDEPLIGAMLVVAFPNFPSRFKILDFKPDNHPWIGLLSLEKLPLAEPAVDEEPDFKPLR